MQWFAHINYFYHTSSAVNESGIGVQYALVMIKKNNYDSAYSVVDYSTCIESR